MLFDPARHEALQTIAWNEDRVREAIAWVVELTEKQYDPQHLWRAHPRDLDPGEDPAQPATCLYYGAAGVIWALHHLQALGAAKLQRTYLADLEPLRTLNRAWLEGAGSHDHAAYLMGDTPLLMMAHGHAPKAAHADALAALISGNIDHPARELMWGSPGTMLAALFLHQRDGDARWAALFQATATRLWDQLLWSDEHGCAYWTQDLYGRQSTYLDAVHGFVATASVLIRGRHLLAAGTWPAWQAAIVNTITRTATREGPLASWRATLLTPRARAALVDAVLPRRAGLCDLPGGHARRRSGRTADRRWRSHLGRRPADQGQQPVPRHRGQRLRLPQAVPAHRGHALARTSACLCHARHRADARPIGSNMANCAIRCGPATPALRSTFGIACTAAPTFPRWMCSGLDWQET
jgi:hypothetical protein